MLTLPDPPTAAMLDDAASTAWHLVDRVGLVAVETAVAASHPTKMAAAIIPTSGGSGRRILVFMARIHCWR
jgi:hypothetical protein